MLKVSAAEYIELGIAIQSAVEIFWIAGPSDKDPGRTLTDDEKQELTAALKRMREECNKLRLYTSEAIISSRLTSLPETLGEFEILRDVTQFEIKTKLFLFVPQHVSQYYEWDGIVSDKVLLSFSEAAEEIRSAGTCHAAGLHTAAVFHAMRAAEIGVRALGADMQVELPHAIEFAEWQPILNGVHGKLRDMGQRPRSVERDADLAFYGEAAAQLQFFKDAWRVRVMHARATYNEAQAREVIDHVRAFFEIVATRLKE